MITLTARTASLMLSLAVMLLLTVAFIAGEAGAAFRDASLPAHQRADRHAADTFRPPAASIEVRAGAGVARRAATIAAVAYRELLDLR